MILDREMPQTGLTKKQTKKICDLLKNRLVIFIYQIGGSIPAGSVIPVETSITLDTLLSWPYRLFARNSTFFGSIKKFCGGDVDVIKTISGVLKVDQRSMSFLASLCSFLYTS